MYGAMKIPLARIQAENRIEPEEVVLRQGAVKKLVVKNGAWEDHRWNVRWLELHKGELRYFLCEGGKIIDRMTADQIAEVKPIQPEVSKSEDKNKELPAPDGETDTNLNGHCKEHVEEAPNSARIPTLWDIVSNQPQDSFDLQFCFLVSTKADHSHRGREYVFKTSSATELSDWVDKTNKMLIDATPPPVTIISFTRNRLRELYTSNWFQLVVAIMILINFMAYVYLTQFNPDINSAEGNALSIVDTCLSVGFGMELLINLFCHDFMKEFAPDPANWFDVGVVATSIIAIPFDGVPGLNTLRLVRVLRIFKLFKSIQSLNKIVGALQESVPAVSNAFGLVFLMCAIYAIMGVTFFRETAPANFGDWATAMFTLYQFLTFDNACTITQHVMELEDSDGGQFGAALFMISFQIFMAYILMNIGMAVLLEEFGVCSQRAREDEASRTLDEGNDKSRKPLDPIMANLIALDSEESLEAEIQELFRFIDEDGSGSIDFIEMRNGFMRMELNPPILFETSDFDAMVVREGLHDGGNLSAEHFQALMRRQLREYELALMNRSVVEGRVQDKVNTILRSLKEVVSATRAIKGLERQVADLDSRFTSMEDEYTASCLDDDGDADGGGGGGGPWPIDAI